MVNEVDDFLFEETTKPPTEEEVLVALALEASEENVEQETEKILQEKHIDKNNVVRTLVEKKQ